MGRAWAMQRSKDRLLGTTTCTGRQGGWWSSTHQWQTWLCSPFCSEHRAPSPIPGPCCGLTWNSNETKKTGWNFSSFDDFPYSPDMDLWPHHRMHSISLCCLLHTEHTLQQREMCPHMSSQSIFWHLFYHQTSAGNSPNLLKTTPSLSPEDTKCTHVQKHNLKHCKTEHLINLSGDITHQGYSWQPKRESMLWPLLVVTKLHIVQYVKRKTYSQEQCWK